METRSTLSGQIAHLPTLLLLILVAWTAFTAYPFLPSPPSVLILLAAAATATLGFLGIRRPSEWADRASLIMVGSAFLAFGISIDLTLEELYLFLSITILAAQLMRFRYTVQPLRRLPTLDHHPARALRLVYGAFLLRASIVTAMVFLISIMAYAAAAMLAVGLQSEITAFLLALAVLIILLAVSLSPK